jgi:hypothetical protein
VSLMEVLNLIAAVLAGGFLTFLATQLVKQESWSPKIKLALSLVMAALFGLATAWLNGDVLSIVGAWGDLSAAEAIAFGTLIWTTATVWYKVVFKDTPWVKSLGEFPSRE